MAGEIGLEGQQRSEEWVIVADNDLDRIAVDVGRPGSPALAPVYEQRFGERDTRWRVVNKEFEHNSRGSFARAVGFMPVKVEATVTAIEQEQHQITAEKSRLYGKSRQEWIDGLSEMIDHTS